MRKILTLGTMMQLIFVTVALAQVRQQSLAKRTTIKNADTPDPVASFRRVVGTFTSFFSGQPRLLVIQDKPPAGLFYILAVSAKNISFDVKKTDSLVTPDVGIINMQVSATSNAACGNLYGWSKVEGALAAAKRSDCFTPWPPLSDQSELAEFDVELKFGFQEGK